jgi:DNA-directed RNA polymerase specialized sigma24 family protein
MIAHSQRIVGGRFRTTCWNTVRSASEVNSAEQQEALQAILIQYLPALKEFLVTRFKFDADFADDLVQTFILEKILKKKLIAQAQQERGRFRTFLLNALYNFAIGEIRRAAAKKRIPEKMLVSLSLDEIGHGIQAVDSETTEQFDLAFTKQVLAEAISRMRQHCKKIKRMEIWEVFEVRILKPAMHGDEPLPYEQLVERFGFRSPDHAANILISGKRMFTRILKSVVGQYAADDREVDEELGYLKTLLEKI